MSKAPLATVADLQRDGVLLVEDGNHGEYRPRPNEFVEEGVAFIRAADMHDGMINFTGASRINDVAAKRVTKGIGRPGDVLLSHKGTVGKIARAPHAAPPFVCSPQTTFWRTLDENRLDGRYLHVLMRSPFFSAQLASRAGETDMAPYVSLTAQRSFKLIVPELPRQRAIAEIISTLDDKINVNRRMNETLEASARALFRDWFVDFGPTRAKAEGRPAYLAPDLWSLFPDRLGEDGVPEGWEWGALNEVLVLQRGFDLPKGNRTDGAFPVIAASGPSGTHNEKRVDGPGVCTGRSGVLGGVYYVAEDFWPLNTSLWIKEYPNSTPLHAFHVLLEIDIGSFNAGSAVPTLNRNHIHNLPVVKSPMVAILAFDKIAGEFYAKREANIAQAATLAATRDALLPKLISGELRVRDSEALTA